MSEEQAYDHSTSAFGACLRGLASDGPKAVLNPRCCSCGRSAAVRSGYSWKARRASPTSFVVAEHCEMLAQVVGKVESR